MSKNVNRKNAFELQKNEEVNLEGFNGKIEAGAFEGFHNIKSVDTRKIISIENDAFNNCRNLKKITLPNVEEIQDNVFNGCIELSMVNVKDWNMAEVIIKKITECGLEQRIDIHIQGKFKISMKNNHACLFNDKIPELITGNELTIPNYDFTNTLENVIPAGAFKDINNLKKLDTNATNIIEDGAFENCQGLYEIYLLNVTKIGNGIFNNCKSLHNVHTNHEMVATIKESLESSKLPQQVYIYDNDEIADYLHNDLTKEIAASEIKNFECNDDIVKIPEFYTRTSDYAFLHSQVTKVDTNNIVTIGCNAFRSCINLEELYLPNVVSIEDNFFCYKCPNLRKIVVKDSEVANAVFNILSGHELLRKVDIYTIGNNEPLLTTEEIEASYDKDKSIEIIKKICFDLTGQESTPESPVDAINRFITQFGKADYEIPISTLASTIVQIISDMNGKPYLDKNKEEIKAMIEEIAPKA